MDFSIIIPVYNEEESIPRLLEELGQVVGRLAGRTEVIVVDDGSTDATGPALAAAVKTQSWLRVIRLRRNFGQSAALDAGFKAASGAILITLDGDLQNDPADIPRLLEQIQGGYDAVTGWRFKRQDPPAKRFFSRLANYCYRRLAGVSIHDSGCSLRAYRRECFEDLDLIGEMHRHIPALLTWKGFKITEIRVNHRRRLHGRTKYRFDRIFKGGLDLLVVVFWQKYSGRPIHVFGGVGLAFMAVGGFWGAVLILLRVFAGYGLANRITPLLAFFLAMIGVQLFVSGILADMLTKTYFSGQRKNYSIREALGWPGQRPPL